MSQGAQNITSVFIENTCQEKQVGNLVKKHLKKSNFQGKHINSVMSDISRLSKSLANSYQYLEGHVEQLNDQLQDVNEQKSEAIEEKHTIAGRLQNLLAVLPSGVVVIDGKGTVRDCNAVAIDILGRPLLGESWINVIKRAFLPQADDGHQISLKDGRKIHLETRALDSEPGQLIVLTDMTKTRTLQAELSQQQKLSSMGKMVASLAHQIRTPLSAAILYGSHLNGEHLPEHKKQEFSEHLMERLKFIERQISDMLNFVKGEKKEKQLLDVEKFTRNIQNSCKSFVHTVKFEIDQVSLKNKVLLADADSLIGAISNLVDNAIDATDDETPVVIKFSLMQNNQLSIQVIDRGRGIAESLKEKLFEPFYSTKNNGNGLGLAIVRGVVLEHGGQILVNSTAELNAKQSNNMLQGSQFNICLPLYQATETSTSTNKNKDLNENIYTDNLGSKILEKNL